MKNIIFTILAFFTTFAQAEQTRQFPVTDGGSSVPYVTYFAKDFNALKEEQYHAFRGCRLLAAKTLIKKEHLVPNKIIIGGFDCGHDMFVFISDKAGFYLPERK